jgi:hypothetical protein
MQRDSVGLSIERKGPVHRLSDSREKAINNAGLPFVVKSSDLPTRFGWGWYIADLRHQKRGDMVHERRCIP